MMEDSFLSMLQELAVGQLVRRESGETDRNGQPAYSLAIHRSLQEGLLLKLNRDITRRQLAFERVITILWGTRPSPSPLLQPAARLWPFAQQTLPHLLNTVKAYGRSRPPIKPPLLFAELLGDVGEIITYDRGFTVIDARTLLKKAEEVLDNLQQPFATPLRGKILTALGRCTDALGISERAEGYQVRQKALAVHQELWKGIPQARRGTEDDRLLFNAEADIVYSLQNENRFDEVNAICKRCRQMYEEWGTEEERPYEWAKYHNHMAYFFLNKGDTQKATNYSRRGYELMTKVSPAEQLALRYRFDLANVMYQNREAFEAIVEQRAVLELCMEEYGNSNLWTLQCRLNIGIMSYLAVDLDEAE